MPVAYAKPEGEFTLGDRTYQPGDVIGEVVGKETVEAEVITDKPGVFQMTPTGYRNAPKMANTTSSWPNDRQIARRKGSVRMLLVEVTDGQVEQVPADWVDVKAESM